MTMRSLAACFPAFLTIGVVASSYQGASGPSLRGGLYDPSPSHLWNQVHDVFHVRLAPDGSEHGFDTVDPLLWRETRYVLTGPSHARAIRILDEFLASNGEHLIAEPLKRAVFQHDLWAVFDWLASKSIGDQAPRSELMRRVARVMRRVALTRKNIEALPDTYAAAVASRAFAERAGGSLQSFLPPDLFSATGPWVSVGGTEPLVPQHATELSRSAFIVLWNVPGGSAETIGYLRRLWEFPQPFVAHESFQFARDGEMRPKVNPALPPVPDGTRIALVRKMLLIDDTGAIVPSNVVQSIQMRGFPGQTFAELQLRRRDLFAGKSGGLSAVGVDDRDFTTFSAKDMDPFESESLRGAPGLSRVLDGCVNCHHVEFEPAVGTVRSLPRLLKPGSLVDSRHDRWARWYTQPIVAAERKSRAYDWGVLAGLWQSQLR